MSRNPQNTQRSNEAFFANLKHVELVDSSASGSRYSDQVIIGQWNASGTRIACSKTNGSVKIWKLIVGEPAKQAVVTIDRPHVKPVESLSWKPTSESVLATVGDDRYVIEWNTVRGQELNKIDSGENKLFIVSYSGDSKYIAAVSKKNVIVLIDTEKHTIVNKLQLNVDIYSITWNHNSSFLFVGLANGDIQLYHINEGEFNLVHTLKGHRSSILTLFFDKRANYLLAGSKEGVISVWSLENLKLIRTIGDIDQSISSVNLSRDGAYISATFEDGAPAKVYDLSTSKLIYEAPRCIVGTSTFPVFQFCPNRTTFMYSTPEGKVFVSVFESRKY